MLRVGRVPGYARGVPRSRGCVCSADAASRCRGVVRPSVAMTKWLAFRGWLVGTSSRPRRQNYLRQSAATYGTQAPGSAGHSRYRPATVGRYFLLCRAVQRRRVRPALLASPSLGQWLRDRGGARRRRRLGDRRVLKRSASSRRYRASTIMLSRRVLERWRMLARRTAAKPSCGRTYRARPARCRLFECDDRAMLPNRSHLRLRAPLCKRSIRAVRSGRLPARLRGRNQQPRVALAAARLRCPAFAPCAPVGASHPDTAALDAAILATLRELDVDTVFLAGYMKQLGQAVAGRVRGKIFNTHPRAAAEARRPRHARQPRARGRARRPEARDRRLDPISSTRTTTRAVSSRSAACRSPCPRIPSGNARGARAGARARARRRHAREARGRRNPVS